MPNAKNTAIVELLREKFSRAKSVVLADYRGLTHKQSEELHRAVKKAGGEFIVAKNSLLKIACLPAGRPVANISGPTAALIAYEDELAPLKELAKTIKNLGIPKIKLGFIGKTEYSDVEVEVISKLPAKEVLQTQLVSRLSSPLYGLAYSLNSNLQKLVLILSEVEGSKGVKNRV